MENCEIRLGLISAVVREQRETRGKLARLRIQLESKREALERLKEEKALRVKKVERAKAFLEGLKTTSVFSDGVESTKDETMSLVREELRRQEDLEIKRLSLETEGTERLVGDISKHEEEVASLASKYPFLFQVALLEKEVEYIEVWLIYLRLFF